MKLQLTGIKASGLRCAELDLQFGGDTPPQFTFIQMPNGTGKTTIADCLRAVLSGEAVTWDRRKISSFQRINGNDTGRDTGRFEARFLFNGSPLAVGMRFDFIEETVSYYTTIAHGRLPKHNLPPPLPRFADPNFVRLYIFDAELPHALLASGSHRAEQAIDAFYQLYILDQLERGIETYWENQVRGASTQASTQQGLTRNQNRRNDLEETRQLLETSLSAYREDLGKINDELREKEPELDEYLGQVELYRQQRTQLGEELADAESSLDSAMDESVRRLQRPLDLHPAVRNALDLLAEGLDTLKLPESTSRAFFLDLTTQEECICGSPMTTEARQNILSASERLLADDTAGVINAFKTDVRSFLRDESCSSLIGLSNRVADLVRKRDEISNRLDVLRSDASEKSDERARELKTRIDELKGHKESVERIIERITREPDADDDEASGCLRWFEVEIKRLDGIIAEAAKLVKLRQRKDTLEAVLQRSAVLARDAARRELVAAMNLRLELLLPGEHLRVADIRPSLLLEGREGVNLGAMLSIGYSFLTTLFERGNHQFPFIVDAPAMGLDGLAREALADILPRTTHQFVGFVLDNERDFARRVMSNVPDGCEFYTVFSDTSRNRPLADQVPTGIEPRGAGTYVIEGFSFFDKVMWTKAQAEEAEDG